jgi:hypothetical protein
MFLEERISNYRKKQVEHLKIMSNERTPKSVMKYNPKGMCLGKL